MKAAARAALPASTRDFFDALTARTEAEDIAGRTAEDLVFLAQTAFREAETQKPAKPGLSSPMIPKRRFSLLVAVNDDAALPVRFHPCRRHCRRRTPCRRPSIPSSRAMTRKLSVIVFIVRSGGWRSAARAVARQCHGRHRTGRAQRCATGAPCWRGSPRRARTSRAHPGPKSDNVEDLSFLDWLAADHFTLLGARDYRLAEEGAHGRLVPVEGSGLGVLADTAARVVAARAARPVGRNPAPSSTSPEPLIITKSSAKSLVHRRINMDYVGVKTYDAKGALNGERRFVGLFTSSAYSLNPREIPPGCAARSRR